MEQLLPPYCLEILPKKYFNTFKTLVNSNEIHLPKELSGIVSKKQKTEYKSSFYIPKYNTFEKCQNFDLHVEKEDEAFERANKIVNILRSQGLNTEFCLNFDQVVEFFKENNKFNHISLYNYSNIQQWNEEEVTDILRQLTGEEENLLLVYENLFKEIEIHLNKNEPKPIQDETMEDISSFQEKYLIYLRSLEYFVSKSRTFKVGFPKNILNPCTIIPISYEWIGYLSEIYFIPWNVDLPIDNIKFPWKVLREGWNEIELQEHSKLWNDKIELRKKGLKLMKKNEELIRIEIQELESIFGKKQNFYELERSTYLLNKNERKEKEKEVYSMIENYSRKHEKREKIFQFCNQLSKVCNL
jgi:hypothetical protein